MERKNRAKQNCLGEVRAESQWFWTSQVVQLGNFPTFRVLAPFSESLKQGMEYHVNPHPTLALFCHWTGMMPVIEALLFYFILFAMVKPHAGTWSHLPHWWNIWNTSPSHYSVLWEAVYMQEGAYKMYLNCINSLEREVSSLKNSIYCIEKVFQHRKEEYYGFNFFCKSILFLKHCSGTCFVKCKMYWNDLDFLQLVHW